MNRLSRRAFLRVLGVSGVGMTAGCVSIPVLDNGDKHDPGALVIKNKHTLAHVVSVSVTAPDSVREGTSREAILVAENGLDGQIPIDAGETKTYSDFLSGAVTYTVTSWLGIAGSEINQETSEQETNKTVKFNPKSDTSGARGAYLTLEITQTGELFWSVSFLY